MRDLSPQEERLLKTRDSDGRVKACSIYEKEMLRRLERDGFVEQNVYHSDYYWVRKGLR